ncbi:hypothetical protein HON22_03115, partial [Candidatus Peregrinibacteria bacterium]|nr:hypothetical protein [Candidatus Peregrinibacteria bacterium]
LGLALGIDKPQILKKIKEPKKIDTPFLELNESNWLFQFDHLKAQGALNDAGWKLPWKQEVQEEKIEKPIIESDSLKSFSAPNNGDNLATNLNEFFIEGKVPAKTQSVLINGYQLRLFETEKSTFTYKASTLLGTMKEGENTYKLEVIDSNNEKRLLDTIQIYYSQNSEEISNKQKEYQDQEEARKNTHEKKEVENTITESISDHSEEAFRINEKGEKLSLRIISSKEPKEYAIAAAELKGFWEKVGVDVHIELLETAQLQERVKNRDYEVLIFGQSLGYNLDAYPYWHSSQADNGFNFSQLKSFTVDTLLEEIRSTHDEEKRQKKLKEVETALIDEMPAIFLYSPERNFALSTRVKGAEIKNIRDFKDRFSHIEKWYVNEKKELKENVRPMDFFRWLLSEIR